MSCCLFSSDSTTPLTALGIRNSRSSSFFSGKSKASVFFSWSIYTYALNEAPLADIIPSRKTFSPCVSWCLFPSDNTTPLIALGIRNSWSWFCFSGKSKASVFFSLSIYTYALNGVPFKEVIPSIYTFSPCVSFCLFSSDNSTPLTFSGIRNTWSWFSLSGKA